MIWVTDDRQFKYEGIESRVIVGGGVGAASSTAMDVQIENNRTNLITLAQNVDASFVKLDPTTTSQTINSDLIIGSGGSGSGNLTVTGNFTVNGTPTQINSQNLDISDNVIVLNAGLNSTTNPNDTGILINRGAHDPSKNAFMGWNEPIGEFTIGITEASGNSLGDINLTGGLGNLRANLIGNNLYIDASNNGDISANDASFNDVSMNMLYTSDISANNTYLRNVDISGGHIGDVFIGSENGAIGTYNPVLGIVSSGEIQVLGEAVIETDNGYIQTTNGNFQTQQGDFQTQQGDFTTVDGDFTSQNGNVDVGGHITAGGDISGT